VDDAHCEHGEGELAGDRAQGLGRLRRGLDLRDAVLVQRHRRRDDDAQGDDVRESHADDRVLLDAGQVLGHVLGVLAQLPGIRPAVAVLDFLRGLPEEQVGADGRAQHGDHHSRVVLRRDVRRQVLPGLQRFGDGALPRHRNGQDHRDVREQGERQPLQDPHAALVRETDLGAYAERTEAEDVERMWPAGEQLHRFGHRRQVGGDVDGVGDDQQRDQRERQPPRAHLADVRGEAFAGDEADARRELLDAYHQRHRQEQRPDQREAELRAGLRIGGDAARIVVGRAGDEPRAETAGEARGVVLRRRGARLRPRGLSLRRALHPPPPPSGERQAACRSAGAGCSRCWPRRSLAARAR
jgi:hypothetical protein